MVSSYNLNFHFLCVLVLLWLGTAEFRVNCLSADAQGDLIDTFYGKVYTVFSLN